MSAPLGDYGFNAKRARRYARFNAVLTLAFWIIVVLLGLFVLDRECAVAGNASVFWSHLRAGD